MDHTYIWLIIPYSPTARFFHHQASDIILVCYLIFHLGIASLYELIFKAQLTNIQ